MSAYYDAKAGRWVKTNGPKLVDGRWVEKRGVATIYAGTEFRSRLEARWAFVFDQLGIHWQYEPQRFVLSVGAKYLPDFFLPSFCEGVYVEVKPAGDDFVLARQFAADNLGRILLAGGSPHRGVPLIVGGSTISLDLVSEPTTFTDALRALSRHRFQEPK